MCYERLAALGIGAILASCRGRGSGGGAEGGGVGVGRGRGHREDGGGLARQGHA